MSESDGLDFLTEDDSKQAKQASKQSKERDVETVKRSLLASAKKQREDHPDEIGDTPPSKDARKSDALLRKLEAEAEVAELKAEMSRIDILKAKKVIVFYDELLDEYTNRIALARDRLLQLSGLASIDLIGFTSEMRAWFDEQILNALSELSRGSSEEIE